MVRIVKAHSLWITALGAVLLVSGSILAQVHEPVQPSEKDKCPICGMFVYKYPDWLAEIVFKDGSAVFFDGAKDLFKYYFQIQKYSPGITRKDIEAILVKEYYDIELMDARKALFVIGSDVYGPMGHELLPFAATEDAKSFMKDHKGKRILRFEEVTPNVIGNLD
jgi:nitrous oxide reductase accessory protein NosL